MTGMEGAPGFDFVLAPRQGRRPLGFQGRLLARVEAAPPDLPLRSTVTLHEAAPGGFVCAIRHRLPDLPGAEERCYALAAADAATLLHFLHTHDPLRDLPASALLPPAPLPPALLPAALAEAAMLGARLRAVWRALLATSFGPWPAPSGRAANDPAGRAPRHPGPPEESEHERDQRV
ncbi:hypothetical protein [Falsiroseomonas selenitidurans]|uniref:Uncharacterized protein n=1 Tax=Falsiroseomonas selenitidurans TaxID=2716335 RepID=A0ABX1EBB2_9PROT|nr:hypothetical protein [Falsiroseomonas selenitidurans]NKC34479.1 hypothetical protein [Falsiroseomonas selenitidurans]